MGGVIIRVLQSWYINVHPAQMQIAPTSCRMSTRIPLKNRNHTRLYSVCRLPSVATRICGKNEAFAYVFLHFLLPIYQKQDILACIDEDVTDDTANDSNVKKHVEVF